MSIRQIIAQEYGGLGGGTLMSELWEWLYRADSENLILVILSFLWITMMLSPGARGVLHWSSGAVIVVAAVFLNMN